MVTTTTGLATSFIQFSRPGATGGGATVTDSDGKIKWAGHNLLTNSESFDSSPWFTTFAGRITPNTQSAPNSTTTADTLAISATANDNLFQIVTLLAGATYSASIFMRVASGTASMELHFLDAGGWATATTQTVTVTTQWQMFTVTKTVASGGSGYFILGNDPSSSNISGTFFIWGAHLYRSDLGGMVLNPARGDAYYPTTPRSLAGYSEDYANAAWTKTNCTISSNSIIAPNGLQTADKVVATATSGYHGIGFGISVGAAPYTFSFYAKAAEYSRVWAAEGGNGFFSAGFDLIANQVVPGTGAGSKFVSAAIQAVGDGWYRCSIVFSNVSAGIFPNISGYPNTGATNVGFGSQYTGDGVSGVHIWGAQLSDSASLDAYSPVYGAAVTSAAYYAPRLDYDANGSALGLLVEEQRANLLLRSNEFNISWVAAGTTVTANTTAVTAPDGTTTADKLVETATTGSHSITQQITSVIGRVYTASVYAKAAERTIIAVRIDNLANSFTWFNLATGVIGTKQSGVTATITNAGGGWYRCSVTGTATATNHGLEVYIADADNSSSYAGDITKGVYLYGAQLEDNAPFATSYIPTGASTATRTADVASVSTQAFPYSATEGTLVATGTMLFASTTGGQTYAQLGDNNNGTQLFSTKSSNRFNGWIFSGGNLQKAFAYTAAGSPNANTIYKIGAALKAADFAMSVNGNTVDTHNAGVMPVGVSKLSIGNQDGGVNQINGWIRQITYLPRRITNAELVSRTS